MSAQLLDSDYWDMLGTMENETVVFRIGFGLNAASLGVQVPPAVFNAFVSSFKPGVVFDITSRGITVTDGCDDGFGIPELLLEMGGAIFAVPASQYLYVNEDGSCQLRITENTTDDVFVIGKWFSSIANGVQFNDHDKIFEFCLKTPE
jgi:hypothetical protein